MHTFCERQVCGLWGPQIIYFRQNIYIEFLYRTFIRPYELSLYYCMSYTICFHNVEITYFITSPEYAFFRAISCFCRVRWSAEHEIVIEH